MLSRILAPVNLNLELKDSGRMRPILISSGECFVAFRSHADAMLAYGELQGAVVAQSAQLVVGWATPQIWAKARPPPLPFV